MYVPTFRITLRCSNISHFFRYLHTEYLKINERHGKYIKQKKCWVDIIYFFIKYTSICISYPDVFRSFILVFIQTWLDTILYTYEKKIKYIWNILLTTMTYDFKIRVFYLYRYHMQLISSFSFWNTFYININIEKYKP